MCEMEGIVVVCQDLQPDALENETSHQSVVTLYNPELASQKGFFLRVPKNLSQVEALVYRTESLPNQAH